MKQNQRIIKFMHICQSQCHTIGYLAHFIVLKLCFHLISTNIRTATKSVESNVEKNSLRNPENRAFERWQQQTMTTPIETRRTWNWDTLLLKGRYRIHRSLDSCLVVIYLYLWCNIERRKLIHSCFWYFGCAYCKCSSVFSCHIFVSSRHCLSERERVKKTRSKRYSSNILQYAAWRPSIIMTVEYQGLPVIFIKKLVRTGTITCNAKKGTHTQSFFLSLSLKLSLSPHFHSYLCQKVSKQLFYCSGYLTRSIVFGRIHHTYGNMFSCFVSKVLLLCVKC